MNLTTMLIRLLQFESTLKVNSKTVPYSTVLFSKVMKSSELNSMQLLRTQKVAFRVHRLYVHFESRVKKRLQLSVGYNSEDFITLEVSM